MTGKQLDAAIAILLADRAWRLDNLYMVLSDGDNPKIEPFKARPEQLEFRRRRHNCNFIPKARKLGMSTEVVIENLDACLFNKNYKAAIVDKTEKSAWDKLAIARLAWEQGPNHTNPISVEMWRRIYAENPLLTDSNSEMRWKNGSEFEAGTSFTGSTLNSLHVSELGPIAAAAPSKAQEIRRGSMNAVVQGGIKTIETTMEGGRHGVCYEYFELALKNGERENLDVGEWRLHFFSWLQHPHYISKGRKPTHAETIRYFEEITEKYGDELEEKYGFREVPPERQAWYETKKAELRDEIYQQFPTVLDEAVRTVVAGQIYPELVNWRAKGRMSKEFEPEMGVPLLTAWDLGAGDNLAGWLFQKTSREFLFLDWRAGDGAGASAMADMIRSWERQFGPILCNFLPHDSTHAERGSGRTFKDQLISAGIPSAQVKVVPKVYRVWDGIEEVRKRIPKMWFHPRCDEKVRAKDGSEMIGGVSRLEGYRRAPNSANGSSSSAPLPDFTAHSADSIRYACEADWRNMIDNLGYHPAVQGYNPNRPGLAGFDPFSQSGSGLKVLSGPRFELRPR